MKEIYAHSLFPEKRFTTGDYNQLIYRTTVTWWIYILENSRQTWTQAHGVLCLDLECVVCSGTSDTCAAFSQKPNYLSEPGAAIGPKAELP